MKRPLIGAAVVLAIGLVVVLSTGIISGHDTSQATAAKMETVIRGPLQRQLRHSLGDRSLLVERLDCIRKSSMDGSCIAHVSDDQGNSEEFPITVDIDPDTENIIWRTQ